MASFVIRHIDDKLWREFKSKIAAEGVYAKDKLVSLIAAYVREPIVKRKA